MKPLLIIIERGDGTTDPTALNEYFGQFARVCYVGQDQRGSASSGLEFHGAGSPREQLAIVNTLLAGFAQSDAVLLFSTTRPVDSTWPENLARLNELAGSAAILCSVLIQKTENGHRFVYAYGRQIVSRWGSFLENNRVGFGDSLHRARAEPLHRVDSVNASLVYLPSELRGAIGPLDLELSSSDAIVTWTLVLDDLCMRTQSAGNKVFGCGPVWTEDSLFTEQPISYAISGQQLDRWIRKWGWDPRDPSLEAVRARWLDTETCWNVGRKLVPTPITYGAPVDVLIVTRNNPKQLAAALDSVGKSDYPNLKVYILDNGSTDDATFQFLSALRQCGRFPVKCLALPVNVGVPAGMNWLVAISDSPLVARLDDDAEIPANCFSSLVETLLRHPFSGAVAPKSFNEEPDGSRSINYCGAYGSPLSDLAVNSFVAKVCTSGGPLLVYRRDAIRETGEFDLHFSPAQVEDLDHAIRVYERGYDLLYDGRVIVRHFAKGKDGIGLAHLIRGGDSFNRLLRRMGDEWLGRVRTKPFELID